MKKIVSISILVICAIQLNAQFQKAKAPVAEKKEHWRVIHTDSVSDNYFWMYDYFGKGPDSAKAVNYLKAENAYLDAVMSNTRKFQEDLYTEMKARIKEKDETVPSYKNGYYYYTRTVTGEQYFKYCRKKGSLDAKEEILLDIDAMAKGHAYFNVSGLDISTDNKLAAFGVDDVSRRLYTIYVKNLETGEIYKNEITNTSGDPCWANDNKTFFYTVKNVETLLTEKIRRHTLGTAVTSDPVVYEETDKSNYIGVSKSKNNRHVFIFSSGTLSSEWRMIDANRPNDAFKLFQPRIKNVLYTITSLADKFLILTNRDSAQNFKLMECPLDKTNAANWIDVIPHRKDVLLEGVEEFKDFIVISERKDGLVKMSIRNLKDKSEHYIDFGESAYSAAAGQNPEYSSSVLRFNYTSFITPNSVYDYDMVTKNKKLMKQQEVLGGYEPKDYVTERLTAAAKDGAKIPISIVYRKGFKKDGNSPLLLYGYGSYGASMDVHFSNTTLSLLNRGFAYAIAHIRGGQELGRQWYEDGKLMKKKNTFTDFIDCAGFLIGEKYTGRKHLYAQGGSAGGLLMGAVVNLAPDLWHGVIAQVPFVDVVNTMLDESIPLTTNEFDEWGNPNEKDAYIYMKSYSPYENVQQVDYPNLLVTTGLHDSQVQYFEPSKWVARLRAMKTDQNILLLHTNMDFGHGGASGRFDYLKDIALNYAFLFTLEGIYK